jgi:hypothetical protein
MNVGRDYNFGLYDSNQGVIQDLGDIQTIRITSQKHDLVSRPYNQPPKFGYVPDGYRVDFTITRTDSELESLQVAVETAFNNGQNSLPGYLNETIQNPDGSITRYQYQQFVFWLTDQGEVSRERVITQRLEGMASQKIKLQ